MENEQEALALLQRWISKRLGIHFSDDKLGMLRQRLLPVCWKFRISTMAVLYEQLASGEQPDLSLALAQAVSTNHTFFFRELEVLDFFRDRILPVLPAHEKVRIWSAAVSSGEEAYTLAIMLAERYGKTVSQERFAILGTDISAQMIQQAERGIYTPSRLETVSPTLLARYFRPVGLGNHMVSAELKEQITFRRLNLITPQWPFSQLFHVIFCRNVLYYFDIETQAAVLQHLYQQTMPGGWLVTSVSESIRSLKTPWRTLQAGIHQRD